MRAEHLERADQRFQAAVAELQALIHQHYPTTSFAVVQGTDPEGTYVLATVDVEDPDAVVDVYIDRLLELQIDEGIPIYVIPIRPLARVVVP